MKLDQTLSERKSRYGDFRDFARLAQALKGPAHSHFNWHTVLDPMHREAIDMILHKIARIVNGDPDYQDSWEDIAGYAKCVVDRLPKTAQEFPSIDPLAGIRIEKRPEATSLKSMMEKAIQQDDEYARQRRLEDTEGSGYHD